MGGEGSGRKPDPIIALRNEAEKRQAIAAAGTESLMIPNYSGIKEAARKDSVKKFLENPATENLDMNNFDIDSAQNISALTSFKLGNNDSRGNFDLNQNISIGDVASGSINAVDSGGDFNDSNFQTFFFYAYAFKSDGNGGKVYSENPYVMQYDEEGTLGNYFLDITVNVPENADGIKLVIVQDDYNGYYNDYYLESEDGSFGGYGNGLETTATFEDPMVLTPKSVGVSLYFDSADNTFKLANTLNTTRPIKISTTQVIDGETDANFLIENPLSGSGAGVFRIIGNYAKMEFGSPDASTNQKYWQIYCNPSGEWVFGALNDAENSEDVFIRVTRTGASVDLVNFPTSPIQANGYQSSDGSAGATTTITTGSLVGKTITVKNGLITSFA